MDAIKTRAAAREYRVMSRAEIEGLIAEGRNIIIVDQHVLKVDAWMKYHPGGDKAIQHMVGRDATDEVTACVPSLLQSPCLFPSCSFELVLTPDKPPFFGITSHDE